MYLFYHVGRCVIAFDIPNQIVSAQLFNRLERGIAQAHGLYVSTEGAVTINAGLTVNVAAITAYEYIIDGTIETTGVSATTQTMSAADATNPRRDIVYVNQSGAVGTVTGTPAASPVLPTLAASRLALAEVRVAANQTVLASSDISDMRVILKRHTWEHLDTQVLTGTAASISFQSIDESYRMFRITIHSVQTTVFALHLRLNNDSGANYDYATETSGGASAVTNGATQIVLCTTTATLAEGPVGTILISKPAAGIVANVTGVFAFGTAADTVNTQQSVGRWRNAAALISRIDLLTSASTFAVSTRVVLEGCRTP